MLTSPLYKYVANPPAFAYMPPVLGGASVVAGLFGWFFSLALGITPIFAIVLSLICCVISAVCRVKDQHISNVLLCRQKFMKTTPGILKNKGKFYVG